MKLTKIIAILSILIMILTVGVAYADTVNYNEGPYSNYELVDGIYKINDYYYRNYVSDVDCYYNGYWHESGTVFGYLMKATSKYGSVTTNLEVNYVPTILEDGESYTHEADNDPSYVGWTRIKLPVDIYNGGYQTRVTGTETSWS